MGLVIVLFNHVFIAFMTCSHPNAIWLSYGSIESVSTLLCVCIFTFLWRLFMLYGIGACQSKFKIGTK